MGKIINYVKIYMPFKMMKCSSLVCLCFIVLWSFSDYEFSEDFLDAFPMLYIPFNSMLQSKKISAIVFPLIINIALWIPMKKSYSLLYGVLIVEKWKAFLIAGGCIIIIFLMRISYPNGAKQYFWSLGFSVGYFIVLHYFLKEMNGVKFLKYYEIEEKSKEVERKVLATGLVYLLVIFFVIIEYRVQRAYIQPPLQVSASHNIESGYITDVSSDQKKFIVNYDDGNESKDSRQRVIGTYDIETGNLKRILDQKDSIYSQYGADDSQIIIQKADNERKDGWLSIYNASGEFLREFPRVSRLNVELYKINFSENKNYFATIGRVVTIWDAKAGALLKKYDDMEYEKYFVWLSGRDYMVVQKRVEEMSGGDNWIVEVEHVAEGGHIETTRKKKIEAFLQDKTNVLHKVEFLIKKVNEEGKAVFVISGTPLNRILFHESQIMFVDVESEEMSVLCNSSYKIIQFGVFPDKNRMVTLEAMRVDKFRGDRSRITFWNLATGEKEKIMVLDGLRESKNPEDIKILQDGDKIISLIKGLNIWEIK